MRAAILWVLALLAFGLYTQAPLWAQEPLALADAKEPAFTPTPAPLAEELASRSRPTDSLRPNQDLAEPPVTMVLKDADPPVTITARQMRYDQKSGRLEFYGQIRLHRGDELIEGDRAIWHDPSGTAEIAGHVRLLTPDFSASAQRAIVNMDLRLAKIYDGRAFFPQNHFYVKGAVMERRGEDTVYVQEGVFTTCDGEETSWSLEAKNLLINPGGMATASGVVFNTRYAPILYLPYFTAPIKNERQSGFLMPGFAHSSRDGFILSLPFFWAIREDYDLTVTPVWRSKRGLAMTLEGRYNLNIGEGIWLVTYLRDQKNPIFNYTNFGQPSKRVHDIYWIRGQNDWRVGEWDLSLDVDLVSDPLSLYAFRNDPDGFIYSQKLFSERFGRTVNEELDPLRLSTFFAQRKTDDLLFRGSLTYVENLYSQGNLDTLQNLPSLYFGLISRPLNGPSSSHDETNRLRFSLDTRYDYFTRRVNERSAITETGHRLIVSPNLSWRQNVFGWASLKTEGTLNFTAYAPNGYRPGADGRARDHHARQNNISGSLEAELSTTLSRVYEGGLGESIATLHHMTPFMAFEIVESPSQEDLPYWDAYDRALRRRTLRYGLRNSLLSKKPIKDKDGQITGYEYQPVLRFGLYSSYEFANNLKWAENAWARYFTVGYFDRGPGPFEIELETTLTPFLQARALSSVDGRTGKFTKHDIAMTLNDKRGDFLSVIYDYESPTQRQGPDPHQRSNQIRGDLRLELTNGWSTTISSRFDINANKGLETYVNLHYRDQCYGVALVYSDSDRDRRVALVFDFLGLGALGSPSATLSNRPSD
ncbi:MAG: LPS assembly protein LptD [Deltaproteobacteria bacterium]|jgi:LPS-assembly protein|nr:LPS assembly protein LptD [Deltaproteobacteria bacterium]